MLTQRHYFVRLYGKDQLLAGILEDARTDAEKHSKDARELVSLLRDLGLTYFRSALPRHDSPYTDLSMESPNVEPERSISHETIMGTG